MLRGTSAGRLRLLWAGLVATLLALVLLVLALPGVAAAAPQLSASPTDGLRPDADTAVSVSGSGYDTSKGVYVAYCVVPPKGSVPSPCGGGVDTSGSSGASLWFSDDPPRYGDGLAEPYGPGGSFRVTVTVTPRIGDVDCTRTACAIVTRNDHTRSQDRSQDVFVPVTFAAPPVPAPEPRPEPAPEPARSSDLPSNSAKAGGSDASGGASGDREPASSGGDVTSGTEEVDEDPADVPDGSEEDVAEDEGADDEGAEDGGAEEDADVAEEETGEAGSEDEDRVVALESSSPTASGRAGGGVIGWVAASLVLVAAGVGAFVWRRTRRAGSSA